MKVTAMVVGPPVASPRTEPRGEEGAPPDKFSTLTMVTSTARMLITLATAYWNAAGSKEFLVTPSPVREMTACKGAVQGCVAVWVSMQRGVLGVGAGVGVGEDVGVGAGVGAGVGVGEHVKGSVG